LGSGLGLGLGLGLGFEFGLGFGLGLGLGFGLGPRSTLGSAASACSAVRGGVGSDSASAAAHSLTVTPCGGTTKTP
jgi:hypothetical protein